MEFECGSKELASGALALVLGASAFAQSEPSVSQPAPTSESLLGARIASRPTQSSYGVYQDAQPEAEAEAMKQPSDWQFIATPYFWAAGMKGSVTVKGVSAGLDLKFDDILDNFDVIGFSTHFEAWHKPSRWGVIADIFYLSLDGDFNTPIPATKVNIQIDQVMVQVAAGYRLVEPTPQEAGERTLEGKLSIDVGGGIRYTYLNQELDFTGGLDISDNDSWFQPYIGERMGYKLNDRTTLFLLGDIGYMQSGSDRSTIWNVIVGVDYKPWSNVSLKGAYHWQDIDVQSSTGGGFGEDLAVSGPTIAMSIYW